jgi:hypothetical protein
LITTVCPTYILLGSEIPGFIFYNSEIEVLNCSAIPESVSPYLTWYDPISFKINKKKQSQ